MDHKLKKLQQLSTVCVCVCCLEYILDVCMVGEGHVTTLGTGWEVLPNCKLEH